MTVDICPLDFGPLSVYSRCFERSVPGPTLVLEPGHSVALPTTLRINLKSSLDSAEFSARVITEMLDKDDYGNVETYLALNYVPFDMVPKAFIEVGQAPQSEIMQVVDINSTNTLTVERGARGSKIRVHVPGAIAKVVDMSLCDVMRQPNRTNIYAHGLHTSRSADIDNATVWSKDDPENRWVQGNRYTRDGAIAYGSKQAEEFDVVLPSDHPRGTFWYSSKYKGSFALQLGAGLAGMLIIQVPRI